MVRGVFVAVNALVLVAMAVLTSLAYASPPDATYIAGIYDAADYDDAVLILTESTATRDPAPAERLLATLQSAGLAADSSESTALGAPIPGWYPRAPPAS